jgi:hypothetical protein
MNRPFTLFITLILFTFICGCESISSPSDSNVFVLYRNSVADENMRIHVATFDSTDGESYNRGNCEQAKELFQAQPGVKTKFWCEKGRFRK